MRLSEIKPGQRLTYFPPQNESDNLHHPCQVIAIGKRVSVLLFKAGAPGGVVRHVSPERLLDGQEEMAVST